MLPVFLAWMSKTATFVDLCRAASEGTTNRVRLKEEKFLAMTIPLPPLPEQRRIVAKIDELTAKIEEARGLRGKLAEEELPVLRNTVVKKVFEGELVFARAVWHKLQRHHRVASGPESQVDQREEDQEREATAPDLR